MGLPSPSAVGLPALRDPASAVEPFDGRPVVPSAPTYLLRDVHVRLPRPPRARSTDTGSAEPDTVTARGRIRDAGRIGSPAGRRHAVPVPVAADADADADADARDCHARSLPDGSARARGHARRSGPVRVDHGTRARDPEDGDHWFRGLTATPGARTEAPAR
ncbi:hypothetical protein GCM10010269_79790 [Streptomyces humidus]|uniref:Uncharacterized protein n=1 Tax=Streptomyces humidus TaxID=52259 RepID=A0A918LBV2_9ACTN|nr:hypothetical protein [Streptomyces humidus]GGS29125.1 hypothetical protein GCM10010269_79790 [Streptomyces humidus]